MDLTPVPEPKLAHDTADQTVGLPGLLSLALGGLVLAGIVAASVVLASRAAENRAAYVRAQQVQATLYRTLQSAQDAETGQRGFLLTGKESYLEPYYRAITLLPSELDELEASLPTEARAVQALQRAVSAKVEEMRRTVYLGRSRDLVGALALVQTDQGRILMDTVRQEAVGLLNRQQQALRRLDSRGARDSNMLLAVDALGAVMVLCLAGLTAWNVRHNLRALTSARAALRVSNEQLATANDVLAGTNQVLEERVAERTADLTAANDEIQRFAYIVSHDLRAPLVNIMGFTSELETATNILSGWIKQQADVPADALVAANDDLPEAIRFIKTSTSKMDRLIGAILKLSREGRRNFAPEALVMRDVLSNLIDSVRFQAGEHGGEVQLEAVPDLTADKVAIEQVFTNVVENALKYRQRDRPVRVVVRGRQQGATAVYEIEDNGRGIADRDRERVFELFRRAGDQSVPGEGIGLAHVRALVRRMGGSIEFRSQLGQGTVFTIALPVSPDQANKPRPDQHA